MSAPKRTRISGVNLRTATVAPLDELAAAIGELARVTYDRALMDAEFVIRKEMTRQPPDRVGCYRHCARLVEGLRRKKETAS